MWEKEAAKLHALPLGLKCVFVSIPCSLCNRTCITGEVANYNTVFIFLEELYYVYFSRSCVFIECVETSTTSEILISLLRHISEKKILSDKKHKGKVLRTRWLLWC